MKRLRISGIMVGVALLIFVTACSSQGDDDVVAGTTISTAAPVPVQSTADQSPSTATTAKPTSSSTATTAEPTSSSTATTAKPTSSSTATTATTAKPTSSSTATTAKPKPTKPVAEGSGCTPGSGPLPDGMWYGIAVSTDDDHFDFDLACYFTGSDAVLAAAEDGEESPPPNDYYVRNVNTAIRELKVALPGEVTWYPNLGDPTSETSTTYSDWIKALENRDGTVGIWVKISNGLVVSINEQWVP